MKTPNYAAKIWAAGDWFYLELPSTVADTSTVAHTVRFPLTEAGLKAAVISLRSRSETSVIGTKGDPTQHNVENLIAEFNGRVKKRMPKPKITAKMALSMRAHLRERGLL